MLTHEDPRFYADPLRFDPDRFLDVKPDTYEWIPFGGGTRRCIGAAFAHMEMDVVLRTLLQRFDLVATPRAPRRALALPRRRLRARTRRPRHVPPSRHAPV